MTVQIVRLTTTEEYVPEIVTAIEKMIGAITEAAPPGTAYTALRLADGVTLLLILALEDGVENPLPSIPEARAFQQQMPRWATDPPTPQPVTVIGSYGFFT